MSAVSLSKLTSNFVWLLGTIGPDAQNFIVRNWLRFEVRAFSLQILQLVQNINSIFGVLNTKTTLYFKGQFDNNFSHDFPPSYQQL